MVKQAEKIKKRNPLVPVFGLIIAIGLAVAAWFITDLLIDKVPALTSAFRSISGQRSTLGQLALAGVIWLAMLAIAFFVVAMLVGKDPSDKAKKDIGLPPRQVKKRVRK